jgi:predicted esterase
MFALDEKIEAKLTGTIELVSALGGDFAKTLKSFEGISADFIATPTAIEVSIPDVEAGNYRLSLTFKYAGATEEINKTAMLHIERGLAAKFTTEKARAARLEAKYQAAKKENLLAALPSAQYRLRLFDLATASEINFSRINFSDELKEAVAILDEVEAGRDPFAVKRGDFRKSYLSKVDNTYQPYRIFVPASYDGTKAYPLIIALHGMGGDENSYFDQYLQGAFKVDAEKRGYIVACPKGREPASMYVGAAERDVMDVLDEVRRSSKVDADRIYLTGHSMGGYGTWSVAMNHPEIFAALAPVAGGGNTATMSKIAHIPQLVVHGDNDKTVAVERSRVMVEAAKKLGAEIKYIEIPGGDHVSVAGRTFKDVFDFFDTHKRRPAEAKAAAAAAAKGN